MEGVFWYVYMLQSIGQLNRWHVGMTEDLQERLKVHNSGKVPHTPKFLPWRSEIAVAFRDNTKAATFEKYLKSQPGHTFANRRFRRRPAKPLASTCVPGLP